MFLIMCRFSDIYVSNLKYGLVVDKMSICGSCSRENNHLFYVILPQI